MSDAPPPLPRGAKGGYAPAKKAVNREAHAITDRGTMPELPEAETIARQLSRELTGRTFGGVRLLRGDVATGDHVGLDRILPGRKIERVWRRAKRVVIDLDGELRLIVRLGMSGRLTVQAVEGPVEKHTHLRATLGGTSLELRFVDSRRFGGIACVMRGGERDRQEWEHLGLEPLETTAGEFRRVLSRRRQIKALLMDQSAIAGLGNIYCDESLHAAHIHPLAVADCLKPDRVSALFRAIKTTLRRAIRFNGSTLMDYRDADGKEGSFQRLHKVYQREGRPCRTCATPIRRIIAAGRSTFFCPNCQPRQRKQGSRTKGTFLRQV